MFSELPKLLDREFAIGFLIPAAAFAVSVWIVLAVFGIVTKPADLDALSSATIALVIIWIIAVILMALNYSILRFFEGYPKWHPLKWRERVTRTRFRRKIAPVLERQAEIDALRAKGQHPEVPWSHSVSLGEAVDNYPHEESFVLPTAFGNVFRAAEVYSNVVYEIDAIPIWPRLQAVLPEEYRKLLAAAKSQLDFCVNFTVAGATTATLYVLLAVWRRQLPSPWILLIAIAAAFAAYGLALGAVSEYGVYIRSAFDLYRGELAKQLGLKIPGSLAQEREMWDSATRMMSYRSRYWAGKLDPFRQPSKSSGSAAQSD